MYVISLVTEHDVIKGGCYRVVGNAIYGTIDIVDDVGDEYTLSSEEYVESTRDAYIKYWDSLRIVEHPDDLSTLRERIEALQEENAELKFRLASLEK